MEAFRAQYAVTLAQCYFFVIVVLLLLLLFLASAASVILNSMYKANIPTSEAFKD